MFAGKKLWAVAAAVIALAIVGTGAGITVATGGDDDEAPITGSALEEASRVALEHTGGGTVSGTEVGDEESYYEVEVTLNGGGQVDVQLDEGFNVVGEEADEASDDSGGAGDD